MVVARDKASRARSKAARTNLKLGKKRFRSIEAKMKAMRAMRSPKGGKK